jgi:phosphoglycerol transferase
MQTQVASDADFVKRIEAAVPVNAMIFQLPYMPFPENVPIYKLYDYDHLLGYLHSHTLRWSYAAIRGRETDAWLKDVSGKSGDQLVNALVFAGFSGIYVDRFGYGDRGASLDSQLRQSLGVMPITSSDGRLFFFSLANADARLRAKYTSTEWQALHEAALALPALSVTWEPSCWPLEGTQDNNFHWCPERGRVFISNRSHAPKKVTFEMTLSTRDNEAAKLQIVTHGVIKDLGANADGKPVQLSITAPPGESSFEFRHAPSDVKSMAFRVNNFHVKE